MVLKKILLLLQSLIVFYYLNNEKTMKKVLGIGWSARKWSYSMSLLKEFWHRAPEWVKLEIADISSFPMFNQDDESPEPDFLLAFKKQIASSDAMLIVTPEYNRSIPPLLKNAIDWASRPPYMDYRERPMYNKPTWIVGAAAYGIWAFGAVHHLRQVFAFLGTPVMGQPESYNTFVGDKLDENGRVKDEDLLRYIDTYREALLDFATHFPQK